MAILCRQFWDILRKRVSPVPCFQYHPLTSLHEKILSWKDTRNQDDTGGIFFPTCFCLVEFESTAVEWTKQKGLFFFFILWHAHELDDMLGVFKEKCLFLFVCFLFLIWVFQVRSLYMCVCVCVRVFCFASPFEWRREAVP